MWKFIKDITKSFFVTVGIFIVALGFSVAVCIPIAAIWYGCSWLIHHAILAVGWNSNLTAVQAVVALTAAIGAATWGTYKQGKEIEDWVQAGVDRRMREYDAEQESRQSSSSSSQEPD